MTTNRQNRPAQEPPGASPRPWPILLLAAGVASLVALIWAYWTTLVWLVADPWPYAEFYSICQIVAFLALLGVWWKRAALRACRAAASWWGVALIVLAQVVRGYGFLYFQESAERYSLVLSLAGAVLMVAGQQVFRKALWVLAVLLLMVPAHIHYAVVDRLEQAAWACANVVLALVGAGEIHLGTGVVRGVGYFLYWGQGCIGSGCLSLLVTVVIVAVTLALLVRRPNWQKVALVASSIPIAILCEAALISLTVILAFRGHFAVAERLYRDFRGFVTLPLAGLMLLGALWLMGRLVTAERSDG